MKNSRNLMAGPGLAAGTYVLVAGHIAFSVPGAEVQQQGADSADQAHSYSHDRRQSHVDADGAEHLTGSLGANGDRVLQAPSFAFVADGLTKWFHRSMNALQASLAAAVCMGVGLAFMFETVALAHS
ncbi:hypothetical protein [Roseinatronobacter sp. S2]|uniref:hypothetical protein n=1 Tax=Roseinatronobacter sp. S2 TaxID=3035471 RepID=UPI00240FFA6A|nr:hypothetical protein [Roseinatronobacter sp. S2]WFE73869.1 hypothetical protein P8S53_11835 [Roseinatronobacter sp. S2]